MIIEITTGIHTSIDTILSAYQQAEIKLSWWAEDIIQKVSISEVKEHKQIKILSVSELGFSDKALNSDIYHKACSSGLGFITGEVALLLAFFDLGQQRDERVLSGMEPIRLSNGDPMVFSFAKKKLTADFAIPSQMMWDTTLKWAFEMS